ncbi:MAG: histidinol-phosphate transaminase [Lachnospiraceae bacterium]|nr:histidinol-phosphate transaminase [Lachnospiraceae bacterium]
MELEKLISHALQVMPPSKRQKALSLNVDMSKVIHMGLNENPYGPSPKAEEAYSSVKEELKYYPDFAATKLKETIAEFYQLKPENVLTGSGSSAMIDMLGITFLNPGDEVLFCAPTYGAFTDMAYLNGAVPVSVPVTKEQKFDLDGMLHAVSEKTKMVIICNPNNPTGTYVSEREIISFLEKLPDHVVTVIDEAYIEFATEPDCCSMTDYLRKNPDVPLLILKTFSKYYGMAGLRVGYALGPEQMILAMRRCSASWNLSVSAQMAAVEAIRDQEYYQKGKELVVAGREYLTGELRSLGCKVYDSQSNFIYFDTGKDPSYIQEQLLLRRIRIGAFACSRVTVGTMEECRYFISQLKEILSL